MSSFQHRSYQKELIDSDNIPFEDIKRNMIELDFINRKLGGHDITLDGIVNLIRNQMPFNKKYVVTEIGCGGGDNLRAIKKWAEYIHLPVELNGIDINKECIQFAKELNANENIQFICSDYRNIQFENKPDIIFSSLFCHHFTNDELDSQLKWMRTNSRLGFFINDLHRHPIAFYSIKFLSWLFSKSYLVKNDAPLSVKRGFKRKEWNHLFSQAGMDSFTCEWKWAYRWLITYYNE